MTGFERVRKKPDAGNMESFHLFGELEGDEESQGRGFGGWKHFHAGERAFADLDGIGIGTEQVLDDRPPPLDYRN